MSSSQLQVGVIHYQTGVNTIMLCEDMRKNSYCEKFFCALVAQLGGDRDHIRAFMGKVYQLLPEAQVIIVIIPIM